MKLVSHSIDRFEGSRERIIIFKLTMFVLKCCHNRQCWVCHLGGCLWYVSVSFFLYVYGLKLSNGSAHASPAIRGDLDESYRCSRYALCIFSKYQSTEWQARVAVSVYAYAFPLKHSLRGSVDALVEGHRSGLVSGDVHVSCQLVGPHFVLLCALTKSFASKRLVSSPCSAPSIFA
jgi:hypothetical protein